MKFIEITADIQRQVINNINIRTGLPPSSIEKDWWVTQTLKALYSLDYANHIAFKGGTCLSKCWKLIERFSEDIDICISREFLGFHGALSKTQISDKLRRAACSFVREHMQYDVKAALIRHGIREDVFDVVVEITPITTTDPEVITITYKSLYEQSPYIRNAVKIEVSGRSMMEPVESCLIASEIDKHYPSSPFAEKAFAVNAVIPERTFLEKVFLLHEEFQKESVRVDRMSRHIYDLVMMMKTDVGDRAIQDEALYKSVVEHRRKYIGLKSFDYDELYPASLQIIPPLDVVEDWKKDYEVMCEHMIYGNTPSFDQLMKQVKLLNEKIGRLQYRPD